MFRRPALPSVLEALEIEMDSASANHNTILPITARHTPTASLCCTSILGNANIAEIHNWTSTGMLLVPVGANAQLLLPRPVAIGGAPQACPHILRHGI
jgi:hypothetical protein